MSPGSLAPEFMHLITLQYHFPKIHTCSKEELSNSLQFNTLPLGIYSTDIHIHRDMSRNIYCKSVWNHKIIVNQ